MLFVCMGNICRSPLAEGIARAMAQKQGLATRLIFDSAGTHGQMHSGSPPDARAQRVAARHGYDLSKLRARTVIDADFDRFDRILVMDSANLGELQRRCPLGSQGKLALFLDYADSLVEKDVPDPYYGTDEGFERVLGLCEQAVQGLLSRLASETAVARANPAE
ncbi:MAG TPA: low molecular weight protein-tyrosine-phosphatase [Accumulibacter sp.]|nr:low molecular weight protein-tyrosine-phosphatase [Accumulibacter sp.]